jgi:methylated-DNA-protein-cysteine methyltransferase related protein
MRKTRRPRKAAKASSVFARVHALVNAIPRGRVATYGELSERIGGRLTPLGIGWALRGAGDRVAWHRVINASGGISTRGESAALQRELLEAEGVRFGPSGRVDLSAYGQRGNDGRRPRKPARGPVAADHFAASLPRGAKPRLRVSASVPGSRPRKAR